MQTYRTFTSIMLLSLFSLIPCTLWGEGFQVKTIVIDAGHGGRDPGAVGRIGKEKDINLNVALLTGSFVEKYLPDVNVIYTRKTDVQVDLRKRPEIANKSKADLFISIHTNAVPNPNVTGASTWLLGVSKNQSNLEMAKLENSVIELEDNYQEKYQGFDPNKDESYIIFSFNATKAYFEQSLNLAQELQDQFANRVGRRNYGIQQAEFWVLHKTTMPSVLIELGFITNPAEEKFLLSKEGQEYMASAIFRSIRAYKKQVEANNNTPTTTTKQKTAKPSATTHTVKDNAPQHGISFAVQFLLSTKEIELDNRKFKKLQDVQMYKEGRYYKYTSGNSHDLSEAATILEQIKKDYPDAFLVAFQNNQRISISKAKKIISQNK